MIVAWHALLHPHADAVEVLWLIVNACGLALALEAWNVARCDRRTVREAQRVAAGRDRRNRAREFLLERAVADDSVASARWIVLGLGAFLLAGIVVAYTPPPPTGRTIGSWVVIALLIAGAAALPFRLIGQRRRRRKLLRAPGSSAHAAES